MHPNKPNRHHKNKIPRSSKLDNKNHSKRSFSTIKKRNNKSNPFNNNHTHHHTTNNNNHHLYTLHTRSFLSLPEVTPAGTTGALPPNPAMARNMNRPGTGLYRDCLRLIDYMAGKSRKAERLREIIRGEFDKNRNETDPQKIEQMKGGAIQGLSNYLTIESLARSGNKFMLPDVKQDYSLFDKRRQMQHASNNLTLSELQQIEMDGPQEYSGVSINGDFQSRGVDIGHIDKDEKAHFVKDMMDDKAKV